NRIRYRPSGAADHTGIGLAPVTGFREREIKLSAWAGFALPDLTGVVDGATVTELTTVELRATYFDTPDLRLSRAGLSLRHRTGGGESGWTVKLPDGAGGPALV